MGTTRVTGHMVAEYSKSPDHINNSVILWHQHKIITTICFVMQSKMVFLTAQPPSYSVPDCRSLVKTLVCGVKTITWGIASCKATGMGMYSSLLICLSFWVVAFYFLEC